MVLRYRLGREGPCGTTQRDVSMLRKWNGEVEIERMQKLRDINNMRYVTDPETT